MRQGISQIYSFYLCSARILSCHVCAFFFGGQQQIQIRTKHKAQINKKIMRKKERKEKERTKTR